jgi:AcrR family transcriptional regulator
MTARARASATPAAQKTMTKFLNAAEDVFGKHGYEGTTIRAIAAKAHVNLGTLKHYWGSKRELFRSLFERRLTPFKDYHLRRLASIEAVYANGMRPNVAEVLAALVEPSFFVGMPADFGEGYADAKGRKRFHLLYGRALMDPSPVVIEELATIFGDAVNRFLDLLRRACPELSEAELDWRVNCIVGAQVFSQVYSERIGRWFGSIADVEDEQASAWVLHFLLHGFDEPTTAVGKRIPKVASRVSPTGRVEQRSKMAEPRQSGTDRTT